MIEVFKQIKGFENYSISNLGRVFNNKGQEIKVRTHSNSGYLQVNLWDGKTHHKKYIHRLMAEAFILNPDNLRTVNHKDGNKLNNTLDNLEWASDEWQQRHAFKLNLKQKVGRYISDEEVFHIYKLYYEQHISPKKISEMLNMPFGTIRKICYQERCKDLFEKYRANLLIKIDKQCNAL